MSARGARGEHPAWCSPAHCHVQHPEWCSDECPDEGPGDPDHVRVHEQAPVSWVDDTGELRLESQLVAPEDDLNVYVELELQTLRFIPNQLRAYLTVAGARRLRDQLSEHLAAADAARRNRMMGCGGRLLMSSDQRGE